MHQVMSTLPDETAQITTRAIKANPPMKSKNKLGSLVHMAKILGWPTLLQLGRSRRISQQTIRGYYATRVIIALFNVGLFDEIAKGGSIDLAAFAASRSLDLKVLQTLCDYLYELRILKREGDNYALDADGQLIMQSLSGAYYLVHAYEEVLYNLEGMLRKEKQYKIDVHRRADFMDRGSGLIGRVLAFPMMSAEIGQHGFRHVLDIGCGDASFLAYLCHNNPQLCGYGLDIEPKAIVLGQKRLEIEKLQGRIQLLVGDLFHLGVSTNQLHPKEKATPDATNTASDVVAPIDVVTMVYVLHELQDQIVTALRQLRHSLPNASLLICEVIRHSPQTLREKPGGLSEIQLFHELSNQRLFTQEEWHRMFADAGAATVQETYLALARTSIFLVRWQ